MPIDLTLLPDKPTSKLNFNTLPNKPTTQPKTGLNFSLLPDKPKKGIGLSTFFGPEAAVTQTTALNQALGKTPIQEVFEAGKRFPRAVAYTGEALVTGKKPLEAFRKGFLPETAPSEKVRSPVDISWGLADKTYKKPSTNVAWEFMKQLPFTTLGTMTELQLDPAIFLTFHGINKVVASPQVAKFLGKEFKAPQWFENSLDNTIKYFYRPFADVTKGVKESRINAITDELYKKFEPRIDELKANYKQSYGVEATETDLKGLIKAKLVQKGIYDEPLINLQAKLFKARGIKPLERKAPFEYTVKKADEVIKQSLLKPTSAVIEKPPLAVPVAPLVPKLNLEALPDKPVQLEPKGKQGIVEPTGEGKVDYGMQHRPSQTSPVYDLTEGGIIPKDIYTHPEYYADMTQQTYKESYSAIQNIKGKPEGMITVYRASPKKELNTEDWVSLSKSYAKGESLTEGTPVHSFRVKAKDVFFAGDDINEFGYFGKPILQSSEKIIAGLEKESAYIQKKGIIPPNADMAGFKKSKEYLKYGTTARQQASAYYEYIDNKIKQLSTPTAKPEVTAPEVIKPTSLQIFRITEPTQITNTQGKNITLPKGEEYRVIPLENGKVRLMDGKQITVYEGELNKLKGQLLPEGEQPKAGGMAAQPPGKPPTSTQPQPEESKERGFVESVKAEIPALREYVSGQYIPRSTDDLAVKVRNIIKDNIEEAERIARNQTDEISVAVSSELIKHYSDLAESNKATEKIFYEKAADIAHIAAENLTELGRGVQAASILGRLTPEGQLRFAAKEINAYNEKIEKTRGGLGGFKKKIPNLTPEQTKTINQQMEEISKMPDGVNKAIAFKKLQNYISDLIPSTLYDKLITLWKAGLLTGIKTSGLNTFSNLFHGVSEAVKDLPAVAVDSVASLFTGQRTKAFTLRGIQNVEGFEKGWLYLKTGYDERNAFIKYDYKRINFGTSKFAKTLQAYEETVFKILGAEDQPFYYGAKAKSLYDQAKAQAINKGLAGQEAKNFIDNLVANPTDEMVKYSVLDAETAVFQNRTILGDIARKIQQAPGGQIVLPFGRTPSAVAMQIINYSPIGVIKTIVNNIGKGRFDQREFSHGIGRGLTGIGLLFLGYLLYKKSLIALDRPTNEREQKLWELEGRSANSIKIGDRWRSIQVFGPAGNVLLIGGHFANQLREQGSATKAMVTTMASSAKSFTEQTFLRGINQAVDALTDPSRSLETFFSSLAGSVVPTLVADIARANDTIERRSKGPVERVKSRIPGLRKTLEPQVNVFGQDIPRYGGNILEVMIDPSRPSKIKEDKVVDELRRLTDLGFKVSPTLLGDKNGYKVLTPQQNTQLWKDAGEKTYFMLYNMIDFPGYDKLSNEDKGTVIEKNIDESKETAKLSMLFELTQGLEGENLMKETIGLKEGRFLTKPLLKKYLKIKSTLQ